MNTILFGALLCGLVASIAGNPKGLTRLTSSDDASTFMDAQGLCWICPPMWPCNPCPCPGPEPIVPEPIVPEPIVPDPIVPQPPVTPPPGPLPTIPWQCPPPTCVPSDLPFLFPVVGNPTQFWQCAPLGNTMAPTQMPCQCGTYFDYQSQTCEFPERWIPQCFYTAMPPVVPC